MSKIFALMIIAMLAMFSGQLSGQAGKAENNKNSYPEQSGSYLYLAGYYSTDLKLTERQMDSVRVHARMARKMARKATPEDVTGYERAVLRKILSEGQFEDLIVYKNMPVSRLLVQKIWNDMVNLHYVSRADSVILYPRIRMYLHNVLVARDYHADNPELQTKYLEELSQRAPDVLYRYYHNGQPRPPAGNYYRSDFIY